MGRLSGRLKYFMSDLSRSSIAWLAFKTTERLEKKQIQSGSTKSQVCGQFDSLIQGGWCNKKSMTI